MSQPSATSSSRGRAGAKRRISAPTSSNCACSRTKVDERLDASELRAGGELRSSESVAQALLLSKSLKCRSVVHSTYIHTCT